MADTIDFNPPFDGNVKDELNRRADANETRGAFFRYWNYQKYCYINISVTEGQSGTAITPEVSMVVGDSEAPTGGFGTRGDMYTSEGTVRKPNQYYHQLRLQIRVDRIIQKRQFMKLKHLSKYLR